MFVNTFYRSPYAYSPVLMLDFSNTSSVTSSGGLISSITNQGSGGSSMDASSSGSERPTYSTGSNGIKYAVFNGTTNQMVIGTSNLLRKVTGATIYVNRKWTAAPSGSLQALFFITASGLTRAQLIGTGGGFNAVGGRTLNADPYTQLNGTDPITTSWNVHTAVFDYANTDLYNYVSSLLDGSNTSFNTATTTSNTSSGGSTIGSQFGSSYANASIAQILIFNAAQNASVRFSFENWMRFNSPT